MRLSVKIEFAAYMYDCLHDGDGSRVLAKQAFKDVYNDTSGIDTDMFEDATEQVQILLKMSKRGLGGSVGSSTPRLGGREGSTSRAESSTSTPRATRTPKSNVSPEMTSNGQHGVSRATPKSPQRSR